MRCLLALTKKSLFLEAPIRRLRQRATTLSACCLAVFFSASIAHAHPHTWIELNSRFVIDGQGRLTQIEQTWEFDVFFSLMALDDAINEHGSEAKALSETAKDMIDNLANYDYFSSLRSQDAPIPLNPPTRYTLVTKEKYGQQVLVLEMTFNVEPYVTILNKDIEYQVYDPTYYISLLHTQSSNIEIVSEIADTCTVQLNQPEPSNELVEYAQNLDRNQTGPDGLGVNFAETAMIACSSAASV